MFPTSDFSFVYCGMATFAATVGYVYAKRRRTDSPSRPESTPRSTVTDLPVPVEQYVENNPTGTPTDLLIPENQASSSHAPPDEAITMAIANAATNQGPSLPAVGRGLSLKRKQMHDHDENNIPLEYPHNLAALYPNKRCKTPPSMEEDVQEMGGVGEPAEKSNVQTVAVQKLAPSPAEKDEQDMQAVESAEKSDIPTTAIQEAVPEVTNQEITYSFEKPISKGTVVSHSPDEPPISVTPEIELKSAPVSEPTPVKPKSKPTSQGFAFEGFATATPASFSSDHGTLASGANLRPTWSTTNNFRKRHSFVEKIDDESPVKSEGRGANALESNPRQDTPTQTRVTGEEDEDVKCELKGVKLFVKRGSTDYSSGILGQVRYLSDKKTSSQRLLFRREPLWKISMNTRLQPAVRCTFDPQECILRLLLAESSGAKASGAMEVVVYALKPGRFCSRKEFQELAESVMNSSSLKIPATQRMKEEDKGEALSPKLG
ncbi:hypothetical protein EV361DRAFT_947169 [Lentinula raphanica]|nr:hypothetical protein EV361DRAFT_947169 [Lentinula raphanica]